MKHHIEERVTVYLRLNEEGTAWEIDGPTFDGSPLYGYDNGPINDECQCDDADACEVARDDAMNVDLPDAWQLRDLLIEAAKDVG